jgi:RNA-directed DNA polymerase
VIKAIYQHIRDQQNYVLVAGIHHGFATINHNVLLAKLQGNASLRRTIKAWLQAGIMQGFSSIPAADRTPQGDPLPLLLAHIALYGIEQAVRPADRQGCKHEQPLLIGYADHFILLHSRLADVKAAARRGEAWLSDLGLHLDPAQTYIAHTLTPYRGRAGFTFSGYAFQQYPASQPSGCKTVLKPGKEIIGRHLQELRKSIRACRAASQETLIRVLNPLIEEWAHFYGLATSTDAHALCDHILHQQLLSWARYRHPRKGMAWLIAKYWPAARTDHDWTFGSKHARMRRHREIIIRPWCPGPVAPAAVGQSRAVPGPEQKRTDWRHELTLQSGDLRARASEATHSSRMMAIARRCRVARQRRSAPGVSYT